MTQKEELAALRAEVAELRKQVTAMTEVVAQLAKVPVQILPTYVPPVQPAPWQPSVTPWFTYTDGHTTTAGTIATSNGVHWNFNGGDEPPAIAA